MKIQSYASALAISLILVSCSGGIQSYASKTKGVDLKKYKTFAWIKPEDAENDRKQDDRYYAPVIVKTSNDELIKKGFTLETENPDAVFLFEAHVENRITYTQSPQVSVGFGFGGPGYYGGYYGGYMSAPVAGGQVTKHQTEVGLLSLQMYDTKTKQLLWSGRAQGNLAFGGDLEADIKTAIKHIFMRLPVKHK